MKFYDKNMKPFFFILALFIALSVPAQSQNVSFVAKAQQAVVEGGKFQLVYTLDSEGSDIRLPALDDFQILMGPSTSYSNSTSIINGRVSREVNYTYTYILKALKVGNYTIPGATIMVDDKKYQSNALSIEVIKSDAGSSNGGGSNSATQYDDANESSSSADVTSSEDLFITVTPSKRDLYQGESLVLTTKIYTKVQLEGLSDIKKPSMSEFIQQELKTSEGISWSLENVNGKTYNVGVYEQTLVFPQKSGRLTIDPTDIEFMVRQRATRRSRSIFDEFFESGYKVTKQRVKSKPIVLNVKPFAGVKPDGFSGGVGSFNLNASVSKSDVVVNDAITMKIDVSGTGNLKFIDEPKVSFPADFESFDVKINNNINATSNGLSGTKTFEYTIIPRYAGEFTIPAINFSYFDAAAGRFITLTKGPFVINVGKGNGSNQANLVGAVRSNVNRENVKYLGKDIRHIKSKVEHLKPKGSFFLGSMMFYFSLILPGLLFLLLYMLNRNVF